VQYIIRTSWTAALRTRLDLSLAKYAGWNTWTHNVPEQRGEVQVQGAAPHTLLLACKGVLLSRNQSHPRPPWITLSSAEVWPQICCQRPHILKFPSGPERKESSGLQSRALFYYVIQTSQRYSSNDIPVQGRRQGKISQTPCQTLSLSTEYSGLTSLRSLYQQLPKLGSHSCRCGNALNFHPPPPLFVPSFSIVSRSLLPS
jgi:hypothetical protein